MVIREFGAINFRNYKELFLTFSAGIYLFFGDNGQGKTNLAEGIYFLTHLSSFRGPRLEQLIHFGQKQAFLQGLVNKNDLNRKSKIEISRQGRRAWLDEAPVSTLSSYISLFHSLLFNPDSFYNYRRFPVERRHFFDRVISFLDHEYFEVLSAFRSIQQQKNHLLKKSDISTLFDWNCLFVEKACVIIKKRKEMEGKINKVFPDIFRNLTGWDKIPELSYRPNLSGERETDLRTLEQARESEHHAGHALHGPHRDDYLMVMDEGRREAVFSQGESRIAFLAILLALNEVMSGATGIRPTLILDDLFSELDPTVQDNMIRHLGRLPNQMFITTTHPPPALRQTAARIMEIRNGKIV